MTSSNPTETPESERVDTAKQRLRLWLRLIKTTRPIEAELRERLRREFGSTLPRFDVLATLSRHPDGLRMNELSRLLMVSNGNVTGLVERLNEDGLLNRLPVANDRRAFVVKLTAEGQAEFDRQASAHQQWINELLGGLSSEEMQQLDRLLLQARHPANPTREE